MIDTNRLLEQFMGGGREGSGAGNRGDLLKGAAAGGLLGLLVGNKKARKMAGGLVGYGGAAAAGALAFKAWQNWQQGKPAENADRHARGCGASRSAFSAGNAAGEERPAIRFDPGDGHDRGGQGGRAYRCR